MATTPPSAGLAARYRVGSVAGLTAGAAIPAIPDTSGNAHPDAAQATAAKQPVAKSVTLNGKTFWVADFDGVDDYLSLSGSALALAQNVPRITIVAVLASAVTDTAVRYAFSLSNGTGTLSRVSTGQASPTANALRAGGRRLDADSFQTANAAADTMNLDWHGLIGDFRYTDAILDVWQDGTNVAVTNPFQTAGNSENVASSTGAIASSPAVDGASFWNGDLAEVLVYLGTPDIPQIDTYIQDTYGIVVADYVVSGDGALTAAPATLSGSGALTVTGSGSLTAAAATLSGTGTLTVTGSGTPTAAAATMDGAGTLTLTGSGSLTATPPTVAGAGTLTTSGTGSLTAAPATLSGTGTVGDNVTGTGALTAPAATATGAGTLVLTGAGDLNAQAATLAAAAVLRLTGSGTLTAGGPTLTGTGSLTLTGSGSLAAPVAVLEGAGAVVEPGALRDITLTISAGRSRTLTAPAAVSRGLAAVGSSRTLTAEPRE